MNCSGIKVALFAVLELKHTSHLPAQALSLGSSPQRFIKLLCIAAAVATLIVVLRTSVYAQDNESISITISGYDGKPQLSLMPGERAVFTARFFFESFNFGIIRGGISCTSWSEKLSPRLVFAGPGFHEVSWYESIPSYALGMARVDITMTRLLRKTWAGSTDFYIKADLSEYTGVEGCRECHETNFAAWSRNRHDPIPACEACHGPGRRHDEADTEEFIFKDTSGKVCAQCHISDNGTDIMAENGFIKSYQEHNELKQTAHKKYMYCITCHNPHYNMREDRNLSIRATCSRCHPGKQIRLHPASITCEDCHMPKAAVRDASEGKGIYRRGDYASHIMRIKSKAAPEDMFDGTGAVLQQDSGGPFLTLNFACLSCHNGTNAGKADLQAVRNAAKLIHSP
jgi:hypothetical protein